MPKCGKPKRDGTPCTLNAMVGKDHCHLHLPESAPSIEVMSDPMADVLERLTKLEKERDYLVAELTRLRDERDDIVEETGEQMARERHGLSSEDLNRLIAETQRDFGKRRAEQQQKLTDFYRELRTAPRLSYTPTRSLMVPFGGKPWAFVAGVEDRYPKCVIDQYEEKCEKLDERDRVKAGMAIRPDAERGMEYHELQALLQANT
jgi:hypothetical protein